jgi:PAS domain S-box-containing protein
VLLALRAPRAELAFQTTAVATVLSLALVFRGDPLHIGLFNRFLTVLVLWVTAVGVTRHRRSLKALTDEKYALDQSAIVVTTNVAGAITYANDKFCQISKYSRAELLGQNHRIVNSGVHPPEFFQDLWETIASGRIWRGEICNRAKDGSLYWVATTIVPFVDAAGRPYQYTAVRYDITARKHSEARLREQESLAQIGKMAAVVAHEVRNPLAGMRGALQIVERRLSANGAERDAVRAVISRIDELTNIVGDLLLFARPRQPNLGTVPVCRLMRDVTSLFENDPQFASVSISCAAGDLAIEADREQLQLVLQNLLLNSAQAMQGRGRIEISARRDDRWHELRVVDDGPGIAPEVRHRLFEPFFTTKHRGTGLGLATARRILTAHGGTIDIQSPAAGGTTVVIKLPADRADA